MIPNKAGTFAGQHSNATRRSVLKRLGAATTIGLGGIGIGTRPALGETTTTDDVEITKTDGQITSFDGTTITLSLYRPTSGGPYPALIVIPSGVNQRDAVDHKARAFAKDKYVVLTFDPRGISPSGGKWSAGGEKDLKDISALIDFLAEKDFVQTDGNETPRVGMQGASGGGIRSIRAASYDNRIDVISGYITPYDLSTGIGRNHVLKWPWAYFVYTAIRWDHVNPTDELLELTKEAIDSKEPVKDLLTWFKSRSPQNGISDVEAPTLVTNGWHDRGFPPRQSLQLYKGLTSASEKRLFMVDFLGHDFGGDPTATDTEFETWQRARTDWLAKHLKDRTPPADSPIRNESLAFYHDQSDSFEYYSDPPQGQRTFALSDGSATATTTLVTDGFAAYDFPIRSGLELAGVSHLTLNVARQRRNPHLFAALADVAPDADQDIETMLINDQITATEIPSTGTVELDFNGVRHTISGGHTLRLVLTLNDDDIAGLDGPAPMFTDGLWIDSNSTARLTIRHAKPTDSELTVTTK